MSRRLNKEDRRHLRTALVEHALGEEYGSLQTERQTLANEAVTHHLRTVLGGDAVDRMEGMPDGWLPVMVQVSICTPHVFLHANLGHERPVPRCAKPGPGAIQIPTCPLARRIEDHDQRREAHRERRRNLVQELDGILESFSTTKQLHERWPEAAAFLKDNGERSAGQLMVPVAELNQRLGLA